MAEAKIVVLYPYPNDTSRFDREYREHIALLRKKMKIPEGAQPYEITRFFGTPQDKPRFYQMFSMAFPSEQALQEAMGSPEMQELGADAARISTGGAPVMLAGVKGA